jgi:hypothetical protein
MWLLLACTPPDDPPKDDPTSVAHSAVTTPTDSGTGPVTTPGHTGLDPSHTGLGATGASGDTGPAPIPEPDFALVDLNPTSPTFGSTMSPRDELRKVSGWYFTHAS